MTFSFSPAGVRSFHVPRVLFVPFLESTIDNQLLTFFGDFCSGKNGTFGTEWNEKNVWNEWDKRNEKNDLVQNGTFGTEWNEKNVWNEWNERNEKNEWNDYSFNHRWMVDFARFSIRAIWSIDFPWSLSSLVSSFWSSFSGTTSAPICWDSSMLSCKQSNQSDSGFRRSSLAPSVSSQCRDFDR